MNILKISWKNILNRPLNTTMSLILLMLGTGIISLLLLLNQQIEEQMNRNAKQVEMVLGAKGSPLQLVLSSVYHIDYPTGNVNKALADSVLKNPIVAWAIPLSYGDNFNGFRIVGTTAQYIELYEAKMDVGEVWGAAFEAVIGYKVAKDLGLNLGDEFESAHGLSDAEEKHEHHHYVVKGILQPSGSVLDQLILTSPESIWQAHEVHGEENHEDEKEITAVLVKFKSPMGMLTIPRKINEQTNMQAALPSIEINRLFSLLGFMMDLIRLVALGIIVISGLSIFISLYNSLKERRFEVALLRTLGASRWKVFGMILSESLILCTVGYLWGLVFSRVSLAFIGGIMNKDWHYQLQLNLFLYEEGLLLVLILLIGLLAALIPAIQALRTDISKTLSHA